MTQTNYLAPPLRSKAYPSIDGETWQKLRRDALPPRCVFCGSPAMVRRDDGNFLCRRCEEKGIK